MGSTHPWLQLSQKHQTLDQEEGSPGSWEMPAGTYHKAYLPEQTVAVFLDQSVSLEVAVPSRLQVAENAQS